MKIYVFKYIGENMNLILTLLIIFAIIGILILIFGIWLIKKILFPKKKPKPYQVRHGSSSSRGGYGSHDVYHHHYVTKDVYVHDYDDDDIYDERGKKEGDKDDSLIDKAIAFGAGAVTGYGVAEYGEEIKEEAEDIVKEGEDVIDDIVEEAEDFVEDVVDDFDDGGDDDY